VAKSFRENISDDFKAVDVFSDEQPAKKSRTKPVPGARLIPIRQVSPDDNQPRKNFDKDKLKELAASIKSQGIIEPITVANSNNGQYKIITGERRFKASKIAGLSEIPCIIKTVSEQDILSIQLIENLQRENLNPVEESYAIKKLIGNGTKQKDVAKLIGKSQPYISQLLKILELPENVLQKAAKNGTSKEQLLQDVKDQKPKQKKPGRPKVKPWMWKPESKEFTIQIKFRKQNPDNTEIIEALEQLLEELRDGLQ
jgi:ParB/RepB/Spo0J family partition protein